MYLGKSSTSLSCIRMFRYNSCKCINWSFSVLFRGLCMLSIEFHAASRRKKELHLGDYNAFPATQLMSLEFYKLVQSNLLSVFACRICLVWWQLAEAIPSKMLTATAQYLSQWTKAKQSYLLKKSTFHFNHSYSRSQTQDFCQNLLNSEVASQQTLKVRNAAAWVTNNVP